jgi:ERCC4-type nuclease
MFNIIVDTREQTPWDFCSSAVNEVYYDKLDSGDYSIEGYEKRFTIERKSSVSELFSNVVQERFERELERLASYEAKFLVFEFSFDDILKFPVGSNIPKYKWKHLRIKPQFVVKQLAIYNIKYGVPTIFAGNRKNAICIGTSLMKEFYGHCQVELR